MMDMCCGDEVKGEGYIFNLILYSLIPQHFDLTLFISS